MGAENELVSLFIAAAFGDAVLQFASTPGTTITTQHAETLHRLVRIGVRQRLHLAIDGDRRDDEKIDEGEEMLPSLRRAANYGIEAAFRKGRSVVPTSDGGGV